MDKISFAAGLYFQLLVFLLACWGWGRLLLRWPGTSTPVTGPLRVTLGMGMMICAWQASAIAGYLNRVTVLGITLAGVCIAVIYGLRRQGRQESTGGRRLRERPSACELFILALILLYSVPLMLAPLGPPRAWDELMYHLPHAVEWAHSGKLQINEWLRYPWFPYNFDLLFAAALILGSDVLPHLLHAATGAVTAWLIYRLATQHLQDRMVGGIAVLIWLRLTELLYNWAYVDMSVAMFVLAAVTTLQEWHASGTTGAARDRRWVFLSAFMMGVAAGVKYQVLALLPLFALALLWHDRRLRTWLGVALSFSLPCVYWYARNALLTGDPFNPVGGKIFGFTDWNIHDYQAQFEDLTRNVGWPDWTLWAAIAIPFIPALRKHKSLRNGFIVAAYMTLAWAASSRYPRYLMFAFPLLALLCAASCMHAVRKTGAWLARTVPQSTVPRQMLAYVLGFALLILQGNASLNTARAQWNNSIAPTAEERDAVLQASISGYGVWNYLKTHPQAKVYQLGLENAIYYAPRPIWGEAFGPWRYRDYYGLPAEQLHQKLSHEGFSAFVIQTQRYPLLEPATTFERYFRPLHTDGSVTLYQLR